LRRRTWLGFVAAFLLSLLLTGGFIDLGKPNAAMAQMIRSYPPINLTRLRPASPSNLMAGALCANNLATAIEQIINRPSFANARWGIEVESISPPQTLYSRDAGNSLVPASNVKLLTTSAALQMLSYTAQQQPAVEARFGIINRDSNNDYAEALLAEIGGTEAVKAALLPLGIDPRTYRQIDGSGLSHSNLAKPSMMVRLLKVMQSAQGNDLFYNSLSIAGVNGTLAHRFVNTPVQGKVHAKTGTLNGVRALSGYLEHPDYKTILFSIMVNQPDQGDEGEGLKSAIDQVVLQLGRLKPCR